MNDIKIKNIEDLNEIKAMLICLISILFGIGTNNILICYMGCYCFLIGYSIKLFLRKEK